MSKTLDGFLVIAAEASRPEEVIPPLAHYYSYDDRSSPNRNGVNDAGRLERVAKRLKELERSAGLERTLAIGEMIFDECYGGREELWRVRRRNCSSVRRLALRPDCPFSKSARNDAVTVYVLAKSMPDVRTFGHVQASHIAAAARLPTDQRLHALYEAETERLSVRELKKRIAEQRRAAGERRGRRSTAAVCARTAATASAFAAELDERQARLSAIALELERVCDALRALANQAH